jgi:hypothetical protein
MVEWTPLQRLFRHCDYLQVLFTAQGNGYRQLITFLCYKRQQTQVTTTVVHSSVHAYLPLIPYFCAQPSADMKPATLRRNMERNRPLQIVGVSPSLRHTVCTEVELSLKWQSTTMKYSSLREVSVYFSFRKTFLFASPYLYNILVRTRKSQ